MAASSAAVGSSGAVPVAAAPAAELSSCTLCVAACAPLAGSGASATVINLGTASVDAEYATWVISKATPAAIAVLRSTPK
ncbi:hypothetical protein R69619_05362 [Paraburkholderia nemoris]|nr:hypothetical protein R69619_05362 [Paraburkholderia nemoris]